MRPAARLAFATALLCSAASAEPRKSVALLGISGGAGMDAKLLGSLEEALLAAMQHTGRFASVVGRSEIAVVLGWTAQKQKLGCDESSSCLAEITGALGVDLICAPDVSRFGTVILLSFKLIDAKSTKVLARVTRKVADEAALLDAVEPAVAEAVAALAPPVEPAPRRWRIPMWASAGIAVVAAGAGSYFFANAYSSAGRMPAAVSATSYSSAQSDAETASLRGSVSFGVAGVAGAAAGTFWWLGR